MLRSEAFLGEANNETMNYLCVILRLLLHVTDKLDS